MSPDSGTHRLFLLGAGFAKPAGLPLAAELLPLVRAVSDSYFTVDGFSHLRHALESYEDYLADIDPTREFDLEDFGAWLDWEHVLRLKGSDTFSEHGNEAGLQLRWAIGKVLHDRTPIEIPQLYVDFASRLTTSDRVLTLNYDLLLERALDAVGLPYRRYPGRFSEVYDTHSVWDPDQPDELLLLKLHGSIDWTHFTRRDEDTALGLRSLVEGPRPHDDPLVRIADIPSDHLSKYYAAKRSWWANPTLLMPPSKAKPMASSPLIPFWDGVGQYANMLGGFTVIGCSLPPGDPYVVQLIHLIATGYVAGRRQGGVPWPQGMMKVVDLRTGEVDTHELMERFRFMDREHTDFILEGFSNEILDHVLDVR